MTVFFGRERFLLQWENPFAIKLSLYAEVVELVDTLGSGSSVRRDVGVRVSPSAPIIKIPVTAK